MASKRFGYIVGTFQCRAVIPALLTRHEHLKPRQKHIQYLLVQNIDYPGGFKSCFRWPRTGVKALVRDLCTRDYLFLAVTSHVSDYLWFSWHQPYTYQDVDNVVLAYPSGA